MRTTGEGLPGRFPVLFTTVEALPWFSARRCSSVTQPKSVFPVKYHEFRLHTHAPPPLLVVVDMVDVDPECPVAPFDVDGCEAAACAAAALVEYGEHAGAYRNPAQNYSNPHPDAAALSAACPPELYFGRPERESLRKSTCEWRLVPHGIRFKTIFCSFS